MVQKDKYSKRHTLTVIMRKLLKKREQMNLVKKLLLEKELVFWERKLLKNSRYKRQMIRNW